MAPALRQLFKKLLHAKEGFMPLLSRALVRASVPALITFFFLALSYIAFGEVPFR